MVKSKIGETYTFLHWTITVISTGSKGNAVLVNDILYDIGVPFKGKGKTVQLADFADRIKYVCITHEHSDHINNPSLRTLLKKYPYIKVFVLESTFQSKLLTLKHRRIQFVKHNDTVNLSDNRKLIVKSGKHGVPVIGFIVEEENDLRYMYLTDSSDNLHFRKYKYDMILSEGNYKKEKLMFIEKSCIEKLEDFGWCSDIKNTAMVAKTKQKLKHIQGSYGHMPVEDDRNFYLKHRKNRESFKLTLHWSNHFYE